MKMMATGSNLETDDTCCTPICCWLGNGREWVLDFVCSLPCDLHIWDHHARWLQQCSPCFIVLDGHLGDTALWPSFLLSLWKWKITKIHAFLVIICSVRKDYLPTLLFFCRKYCWQLILNLYLFRREWYTNRCHWMVAIPCNMFSSIDITTTIVRGSMMAASTTRPTICFSCFLLLNIHIQTLSMSECIVHVISVSGSVILVISW